MAENFSLAYLLQYGGDGAKLTSFCTACCTVKRDVMVLDLAVAFGEETRLDELMRRSKCKACEARGVVRLDQDSPLHGAGPDMWKGPSLE